MSSTRLLLALLVALCCFASCVSPDEAPFGPEGEVVRTMRAPLDRTWRETVAAVHQTGIVVPHDQRPDEATGEIRTDELRITLTWQSSGETTLMHVLYYDSDALRARVRGESLLDSIEDRLDRR